MDSALLKERAKLSMGKNHWLCVGVAILATITISIPQYSIQVPATEDPTVFYNTLAEYYRELFTLENIVFMTVMWLVGSAISFATRAFFTNQVFVGSCRFFLKLRKDNRVYFSEIFQSYKDKTYLNIAKVTFFRDLYVFLWGLLFTIPGIIKYYEYFAVDYILAVRPDMDKNEALDKSKKMMYGHKADLFVLGLSFLGWIILSMFLCAIPFYLYVLPYMRATCTEFYSEVRRDAIFRGIITANDVPDYQPPAPFTPYNMPYGNVPPAPTQAPIQPNTHVPPVYPQNYQTQANGYYQQNAPYQPPYYPPYYPPQQQYNYPPTMVDPQYNGTYNYPTASNPYDQMPYTPPVPPVTSDIPVNESESKTDSTENTIESEKNAEKQDTQGDKVE